MWPGNAMNVTGARRARSPRARGRSGGPPSRPWRRRCRSCAGRRRSSTRCGEWPTGSPPNITTRAGPWCDHDGVAQVDDGEVARGTATPSTSTSPSMTSTPGPRARRAGRPGARRRAETSAWNSGDAPEPATRSPKPVPTSRRSAPPSTFASGRSPAPACWNDGSPPPPRRAARPTSAARRWRPPPGSLVEGERSEWATPRSGRHPVDATRARSAAPRRSSRGGPARRRTGTSPSPARCAGVAARRRPARRRAPQDRSGRRR